MHFFPVLSTGQAPPLPVILLDAEKSQHLDAANISWIVPELTYTEETYTVIFYLQWQPLEGSTLVVKGNSNISLQNVLYSVDLTNLQIGETYAYQIVSNNTIGLTAKSEIKTFDAGMFKNS